MANEIFDELDLRLSTVRRWTILHMIRQQSVAEHSYNVCILAERIAVHWFNIQDPGTLYNIQKWALRHDRSEAFTGDYPTIVKDLLDEAGLEARYADLLPTSKHQFDIGVQQIVKLADRIDAIIFLKMEISMGNKTVAHVAASIERDLLERMLAWYDAKSSSILWQRYNDLIEDLFPAKGKFRAKVYDRRADREVGTGTDRSAESESLEGGIRFLHGDGSGEDPDYSR